MSVFGEVESLRQTPTLLGLLALALGLALLLPGAASATRQRGEGRAGRHGVCEVTIDVAASRLTAGESTTVAGTLVCPLSSESAEQTVTIYEHVAGTPAFAAVGTATTDADGAYELTTEPMQANSAFYARSQGAHSGHIAVKVAPAVSIGSSVAGTQLAIVGRGNGAAARAGSTVTFTGTVSPQEAGALVVLQRESATVNENWFRIGLGEVASDGRYSITHTFTMPGTTSIRVIVRARGMLPGVSEPLPYEIAQRQNPRLTIQGTAQPLTYGQSVTPSGTAAGAVHQPLTLLAHTAQHAFAPVATVTTDGSGNYRFPTQSPLQSTWYRVMGARTSSTTLFEGVKPLLSGSVSSTAVTSGEPLTFSGTIAPARSGEVVYLERENGGGVGFHIIGAGTLGAGGSYSIEHTVSGAGTQIFRTIVSRSPQIQAAASEPLKVEVTPSPAGSLEPEAPVPGSSLSGEG